MKKISIALFSMFSVLAFAKVKTVTVKGQAALELFDRIERTGVERNVWTNNQGVDHISLDIRKMICDTNTHVEPNPTLCTILPGFMQKPIVSEGAKAHNILNALYSVEEAASSQNIYFGDCAMGKCTYETGSILCSFYENDTAHAECEVTANLDL